MVDQRPSIGNTEGGYDKLFGCRAILDYLPTTDADACNKVFSSLLAKMRCAHADIPTHHSHWQILRGWYTKRLFRKRRRRALHGGMFSSQVFWKTEHRGMKQHPSCSLLVPLCLTTYLCLSRSLSPSYSISSSLSSCFSIYASVFYLPIAFLCLAVCAYPPLSRLSACLPAWLCLSVSSFSSPTFRARPLAVCPSFLHAPGGL